MWRLFLSFAIVALAWAGWRYYDDAQNRRGVISFDALAEAEAETAPVTTDGIARAAAPMGIEGPAQTSGPDLSAALEDVALAYDRPRAMPYQRAQAVSFMIDPAASTDLMAELEGFVGDAVQDRADVTAIISASLSGPGFEIERLRPERQMLSVTSPSSWEWSVTATQAGEHELTLEVFAYPGGGAAASPVRAYRDTISVTVGPVEQVLGFARTAEPAIGVMAGAASFLLALFGLLRRR